MLQFTHMLTKSDIKALLEEEREHTAKIIDQKLEPIKEQLNNQGKELSHIKTAIKPLATKEDVETEIDSSKTEILSAILALNAKVTTKVHKHDKSINALHEGTGVPDPNTH